MDLKCSIDWNFSKEDVEHIKRILINNEKHNRILPYLKGVRSSKDFMALLNGLGHDFSPSIEKAGKVEIKAKEQLAASAACVALYITANAQAKPSSKAASMRGAKTLISNLGIALPMEITARLNAKIFQFDDQARKEKSEATGEAKAKPSARRPASRPAASAS